MSNVEFCVWMLTIPDELFEYWINEFLHFLGIQVTEGCSHTCCSRYLQKFSGSVNTKIYFLEQGGCGWNSQQTRVELSEDFPNLNWTERQILISKENLGIISSFCSVCEIQFNTRNYCASCFRIIGNVWSQRASIP